TSARLRSSLLAYGSKASTASGGGDGCLLHSHRAPTQLSRDYCGIKYTWFLVIISARDNFGFDHSWEISQLAETPLLG
ncbi:MAG: hypothetical protein NTZ08_13415, partial [Verrucomicrobia bacterium]|nr:hypothetical protein [Verrucomicrobiota bacterium]